jgi:SAM-dependent methyltransferase
LRRSRRFDRIRAMKKVLNVGGNNKNIPIPPHFGGFEHLLLDIDPRVAPDVLCDARQLGSLPAAQFDAVYCSHNLEHYYRHDVRRVLAGFLHVLKPGGFAQLIVPDLQAVMKAAVERGLDVEDVLYQSPSGPINVLDVLYGYGVEIERSGLDFYAHKTGFSQKALVRALQQAGFGHVYSWVAHLDASAIAFKGEPEPATRALLGLPQP